MNNKPDIIYIESELDLTELLSNYLKTGDTEYATKFFDEAEKDDYIEIGYIDPSFDRKLLLYKNSKGTSIIDYLLKNYAELDESFENYIEEDYEIYKEFIKYDSVVYEEEDLLKMVGDSTLLEKLIDDNIPINTEDFKEQKTIDILLNKKRYDLLIKCDSNILTKMNQDGRTYLDLILDEYTKNRNFDISKYIDYELPNNIKLIIYYSYAKRGLIDFLEAISADELFQSDKDGKLLIDMFLEQDQDLSINTIFHEAIKMPEVQVYFKLKGINYDCDYIDFDYDNDYYLEGYDDDTESYRLSNEDEEILSNFVELMLEDEDSDDELIELLTTKTRVLVSKGNRSALDIIRLLSLIKENNPSFIVSYDSDNLFNKDLDIVQIKDPNSELIFHEIGHALHYYLLNNEIPSNFYDILKETQNNPNLLPNVNSYVEKYDSYENDISKYLEKKYLGNYDELVDDEEIKTILLDRKNDIIDMFTPLGYKKEDIENCYDSLIDINKYKQFDKKSRLKELINIHFFNECLLFAAIGDMLDCITEGKVIKTGYVHGEVCFNKNRNNIFLELFADYIMLKIVDNNEVMIKYFKKLVGSPMVDLLDDFYQNRIINSNKYESISLK